MINTLEASNNGFLSKENEIMSTGHDRKNMKIARMRINFTQFIQMVFIKNYLRILEKGNQIKR